MFLRISYLNRRILSVLLCPSETSFLSGCLPISILDNVFCRQPFAFTLLPIHSTQVFSLSTDKVVSSAGSEDLGETTNQSYWVCLINQAAASRIQTSTEVMCLKCLGHMALTLEKVAHLFTSTVPCYLDYSKWA